MAIIDTEDPTGGTDNTGRKTTVNSMSVHEEVTAATAGLLKATPSDPFICLDLKTEHGQVIFFTRQPDELLVKLEGLCDELRGLALEFYLERQKSGPFGPSPDDMCECDCTTLEIESRAGMGTGCGVPSHFYAE